jgi:hypothetical protein
MLEVPGWSRHDLETAPEEEVLRLRWGLYARVAAPSATRDIAGQIEQLDRIDNPRNPTAERGERRKHIEELRGELAEQRKLRVVLCLDEPEERA